jgi:crossover junction endodeoxyribonuclease RuvC
MGNTTNTVLGIDPGYDCFGWAVVLLQKGKTQLVDCGCIETDRQADRFDRYLQIQHTLQKILDHFHPNIVGLEQLYFSKNVTTALPVAEVRGLAIGQCIQRQISVREFNPGTVKSAITGNGRADKNAMRKMIMLQLGSISEDFRQRVNTELDDTIDAIGVALTAAQSTSSV